MVDSTWTTVWGKGKIQLYVCACQLVVSNPNRMIKKCDFVSFNGGERQCS